jgi:hypothetical protein
MNRHEAIAADTKRFLKYQEEHNTFLKIAAMLPESLDFKNLSVHVYKADAALTLFPQDHKTILTIAKWFPAIPLELERNGCVSMHPIESDSSDNLPICSYYYTCDGSQYVDEDNGAFHWWTRRNGKTIKVVCPTIEKYAQPYKIDVFSHHDGHREIYKKVTRFRSRFAGADMIHFAGDRGQYYWDTTQDLLSILENLRICFE